MNEPLEPYRIAVCGQRETPRVVTTYLCGGIHGLDDAACRDWRETAKRLLKTETLDPMRRDYRGREDDAIAEIIEGDTEDIGASHFVLVNAARPSWGTAMELVYAQQECCFVAAFGAAEPRSPWLQYHVNEFCATVEEACAAINREAARL